MDTDPYPNRSIIYGSFCKKCTGRIHGEMQKGVIGEEYFLTSPGIIYFNAS